MTLVHDAARGVLVHSPTPMRLEMAKGSVVVVAGSLLAATAAAAGCSDESCNDDCPIARFVEVHIQSTADVLERSTLHVCINAQCTERPVLEAPDAGATPDFVPATDLHDGWFTVVTPAALQNAAVVHATVTNAAGTPLLDDTRTTKLFGDDDGTCSCGSSGDFVFYPGAVSGLTCTGTSLASGVSLNGILAATSSAPHTLTVCRNALCSTQTLLSGSEQTKRYAQLNSPLAGSVSVSSDGQTLGEFEANIAAQPEELADGDVYRVTLDDGKMYNRTAVATYVESYPDGQDCDTMPLRTATIDL